MYLWDYLSNKVHRDQTPLSVDSGLNGRTLFIMSSCLAQAAVQSTINSGAYKQQKFVSRCSEGGKSEIGVQHGQVLVRLTSRVQTADFLYPHKTERAGEIFGSLL